MKKRFNILCRSTLAVILAGLLFGTGLVVSAEPAEEVVAEAVDDAGGLIPLEAEMEAPVIEAQAGSGMRLRAGAPLAAKWPQVALSAYPALRNQNVYEGGQNIGNTCWAFSTIALAEIERTKRDASLLSNTNFSEMALAYSTYHLASDPLGGLDGDSNTVDGSGKDFMRFGGNPWYAMENLFQWAGVVDEKTVPYSLAQAQALRSKGLSASAARSDVMHITSAYMINVKANQSLVKQAIIDNGAVIFSYAMERSVNQYYNAANNSFYNDSGSVANHAVAVIGWDDGFSADRFNTRPAGDGAWLVRNSWTGGGSAEGRNGYFWLSYYDTTIGDSAFAATFTEAENSYDNNYQYDGGIIDTSIRGVSKAANLFQAKAGTKEEVLRAFSLGVSSANTSYKADIYLNPVGSDPESGSLVATKSGSFKAAGIYQIALDTPVTISYGDRFAVVVTLSGGGGEALFRFDQTKTSDDGIQCVAKASKGESLIWTAKGGWQDLQSVTVSGAKIGNVRIKAFTDKQGAQVTTPATQPASSGSSATKPASQSGSISVERTPMYRLYNPNSGEHFYTASVGERNHLDQIGWNYEGIGWYAPSKSNTPVYRLYNANAGDHHYTMSKGERNWLISLGWSDEGIGWYSDDAKAVPLYRQYNPYAKSGSHNYTTSKAENNYLVSLGWHAEGIGWYGQ